MAAESCANLCELFAKTVERYPDNLAVDHADGRLTYRELDSVSSSVASNLRKLGVFDGSPVILVTAHGTLNIVAIIAILKAGGFFVPIDRSTWCPDAIKHVFDVVEGHIAVNTTPETFALPDGASAYHVLHLSHLPPPPQQKAEPVHCSISATSTACTIFTSGSTGRAKGVMISHRSLASYTQISPANLDVEPGDRLLHLLSVAFDASTCVLFSALLNGGTVVPATTAEVHDVSSSCTVMAATPSLLSHLPRPTSGQGSTMYARMRTILLGGETGTSEVLESWIDAGIRVLTAYGATETTSMGCIREAERDPLTGQVELGLIGRPMTRSRVWLLDGEHKVVEDDLVEGEIVIEGDGVAQGYYKDDTRTAGAFLWWNGRRGYKTGDYGRWVRRGRGSKDRALEFRGRKDRTVKNRGFLVNLDRDVEDGLYRAGTSLGIKSVRAAMTESGIVAVVSPSSVDTTALLAKARQSMSAYCVPYHIAAVDDIPLSPNGKTQLKNILDVIAADGEERTGQTPAGTRAARKAETPAINTGSGNTEGKLERVLRAVAEVLRHPGSQPKNIRPEDTFTEVGGSSLLALKFVSALRQLNLDVSARDLLACRTLSEIAELATPTATTLFASNVVPSTDLVESPEVERILADLRTQARSRLRLPVTEDIEVVPLTSLQLELALPTLTGDPSRYVNQFRVAYKGVWAGVMERAWRAIWRTEPVFRSQICLDVASGVQVVHSRPPEAPKLRVCLSRRDYDTAVENSSMAVGLGAKLDFLAYRARRAASPEMAEGGEEEELTVILTVHHSLMDGCSLRLLLDKLEKTALGWAFTPSPSPVRANLALISIQQSRDAEARAFFADYLKGMPLPQPSESRHTAAAGTQHVDAARTAWFEPSVPMDELTDFARSRCVSAACVYYTAWAMAMSVLEGSPRVIVGAVFSSRAALPSESEDAVGLYMSTLPLVFRFDDGNETVTARLQQTMSDLARIGEYAWARSDQVGLGHRLRNLLSMQLPLPSGRSRPPAARAESLENSDFPLSMLVEADGSLRLLYNETHFDEKTVRRVGEHFKHGLSTLLREHRVDDCMRASRLQEDLFGESERVRIEAWERRTVKDALEEAMARHADLTALEDCSGMTMLSYSELDKLTSVIAHHINIHDAAHNNRPVAIFGDGTVDWVLATLAVVRTNRTFVPLDPKWPAGRRAAVCEQSGATTLMLVPRASQVGEVPAIPGMGVLAIDTILRSSAAKPSGTPERLGDDASSADPDDLLTIVFTSGTTGVPKGVPLSHRGFLALQTTPEGRMFAAPGRRIAQFMSPAFDVCNAEIFSTLLHGATLVLRDPLDPFAHLARVNTASMTPSVLATLDLSRFPGLELVYSTGEPMTSGLMSRFAGRTLLYNAYGPAECIIWSSITRMIPGDRVNIGTGLETARMYVLDEDQHHSPDQTRGEIYVSGVQVMEGYIGSAEQTALRVLPDPWHPGDRMYRTGDYGMRRRDGRIVFQGRVDRQVKIRGFRVELPGVEQAILSGPPNEGISQCAAIAIHNTLIAFVTLDKDHPDQAEDRIMRLRDRLADTLLPSWVPQVILPLVEGFPRTANDKADTRALEAVYASRLASQRSSAETSPLPAQQGSGGSTDSSSNSTSSETSSETASNSSTNGDDPGHIKGKLAAEWRRVLQLRHDAPIQDSDNFIRLGGHSVLIMLLATRLREAFGVDVPVRHLLPTPSFQDQVELIQRLLGRPEEEVSTRKEEPRENETLSAEDLSELEKPVWFQCQVATNSAAFNIATVLHLQGTVDLERLVVALEAALAFDPVWRSNFVESPDGPRRRLRESVPRVRRVAELDVEAEARCPFNLESNELIRFYIVAPFQTKDEASPIRLLIVTTHVIADLGSLQNLLQLVSSAYAGTAAITKHQHLLHLASDRWTMPPSTEALGFWRTYLGGHGYHAHKHPIIPLPSSATPTFFKGVSRTYEFRGRLIASLNTLIRRVGVTHHHLALTAAALAMQWLSRTQGRGQSDIVLGAPNGSRSSRVERQALGQFLDRLPVRVMLQHDGGDVPPSTTTTTTLLAHVRDSAGDALANAIRFSAILAALDYPSGGLCRHPLFECMVTFHTRGARLENWLRLGTAEHTSGKSEDGLSVTWEPLFVPGVAKFPLMLEWFELGTDGSGNDVTEDRWLLHLELHDLGSDTTTGLVADAVRDALEIILRALVDECPIEELKLRLQGLQAPALPRLGESTVASDETTAESHANSAESPPAVVELASRIRDEMVGCLRDVPTTRSGSSVSKFGIPLSMSFFEAGADSVAAVTLRHRLKRLGVEVSLRDVFLAQSPLKLAEQVLQ